MKNIEFEFETQLQQNIETHLSLVSISESLKKAIIKIEKNLKKGGKLLFCGNGGSAADAQHLSAEFLVRLRPHINRNPIPAISLAQDTSTITACGNDYGFKKIFTRSLAGLYKKNDIVVILSTSGNSENIIDVLKYCKKNKIKSIGLLGNKGGIAKKYCDTNIVINSSNTARIQELHIFLGHFIFESVENLLFKKNKK